MPGMHVAQYGKFSFDSFVHSSLKFTIRAPHKPALFYIRKFHETFSEELGHEETNAKQWKLETTCTT